MGLCKKNNILSKVEETINNITKEKYNKISSTCKLWFREEVKHWYQLYNKSIYDLPKKEIKKII